MITLEKIKQNIAEAINKTIKKDVVSSADLIYPPNPGFGDLSLPCFVVAKKLNKSAVETAEFLIPKVKLDNVIATTKAIGPYLNFTLNKINLAQSTIEEILKMKEKYGENKDGKNEKIMIEFANGNTHKEYHVGHLRNVCYGDAITKILAANGYKAIPVSYVNDFGIHVAKTIWALNVFYQKKNVTHPVLTCHGGKTCLGGGEDNGNFLGKVYVKACEEIEKDSTVKEAVSLCMKNIESCHGADYKLWQKTRKWSIDSFAKIHQELGIKFNYIFYESEEIKKGLSMVNDLYAKHFLIKSQGAIIADLNKYNLGVLLFLRSDGTALYSVADLPLAIEKFKKYKINKSIHVVDVRQTLYFKQLFKILELLGYKKEAIHLVYEFVKLPEGMMASRTGNVITYEDLRARILEKTEVEIKERHKNWNKIKVHQVANKITNGAIKFEMIKISADKIITFDIDHALRFEGYTAAYLQYTSARISSILKKSKIKNFQNFVLDKQKLKINLNNLKDVKEEILIYKLAKYSEIIKVANKNYDPSEIAKYLFELAQEFNDYYHAVPVLKTKTEIRQARLILIIAIRQVISNGLELLGIEAMEEM
ncbi:MAG: arginine--tRNA ligase [Patescibacteria group bacterium]